MPGPYQVALHVDPYPAVAGELALIDLKIRHLGRPVNALVVMKPEMLDMPGMASPVVRASPGSAPGEYTARVPLAMAGDWNLRVGIAGALGREEEDFTVTAVSPGTSGWATRGGTGPLLFGIFAGLMVLVTALALVVRRRRFGIGRRGR